jgi:hypothetical protein
VQLRLCFDLPAADKRKREKGEGKREKRKGKEAAKGSLAVFFLLFTATILPRSLQNRRGNDQELETEDGIPDLLKAPA